MDPGQFGGAYAKVVCLSLSTSCLRTKAKIVAFLKEGAEELRLSCKLSGRVEPPRKAVAEAQLGRLNSNVAECLLPVEGSGWRD